MPKVLNKRYHGVPEGAVFIGRPSKWGNMYRIGVDGTREEVIEKHKEYVDSIPGLKEIIRKELAGKNLVCFCAPQACHGDYLLEVANAVTD